MRHDLLRALANQVQLIASIAHTAQVTTSSLGEANPSQLSMIAISEIQQIVDRARAVCHIQVPRYRDGEHEENGSGSGWLIAPGLVITCWHVIAALFTGEQQPEQSDVDLQVKQTLILFDYTQTGKGIGYSVAELIYPSAETQEQDFAILRLKNRDDYPYFQFDYLPIERDAPLTRQVSLPIIQHPLGKEQQIASGNFADFANESGRSILYTTPTESGTSGAPVLKRHNWSVVAVHNGENRSKGLREGITIQSILSELEKNKPDLYREIMQAQQKIVATPTANSEASIAKNAPPHTTTRGCVKRPGEPREM
jgi:endonuclease G, mitochondrial